jgi:hypothetical protein
MNTDLAEQNEWKNKIIVDKGLLDQLPNGF